MMDKEISIYVHIPFCVKKCLYCDFCSFPPKESDVDRYFRALCMEIRSGSQKYKDYVVKSVFFGGGTPSFVDSKYICESLNEIKSSYNLHKDAEISIEANPASAIYEKLSDYRKCGFNRISIGAQSFDDRLLRALGRAHSVSDFYETFENARKAGFDNINVDIMSALPGQSLEDYMSDLKKAVALSPEHISAYSLIIEEGTPFYDMDLDLPSEEVDRMMYHKTKKYLAEHGYHRYEISNYALDGKRECYHNKVYWRRGNYLGFGLSAASMVENVRWNNTDDLEKYLEAFENGANDRSLTDNQKNYVENYDELDGKSAMEEYMFLGLRLVEGISVKSFKDLFGKDINEVYGDVIAKYKELHLLEETKGNLRLTEKGLDVSNTVMAEFLLE